MKKTIAMSLISLVISTSLNAQDFEVDSKITAATVYDDRAAIIRTISTRLNPGASTLIVKNLPGNVLIDSLRVSGIGAKGIEIASVEARRSFYKNTNNETEQQLRDEIQELRDQHKAYQDQIEALDLQKSFMTSLLQTQPKIMREEMEIGKLDPAQWEKAWNLIQGGSSDMLKSRSTAVIAQREINKEIKLLSQKLSKLSTGQKQTVDAYISVESNTNINGVIDLEYQIPGASWKPLYDARLDTDNARLRLDQLASVSQVTGEDWTNIKLTLSTHRPSVSASFNQVNPWLLNFFENEFARRMRHDKGLMSASPVAAQSEMLDMSEAREEVDLLTAAKAATEEYKMKEAIVASTAFSAEYIIPGRVSLVSERNTRKFKIKDQSFDTDLLVMVAPHRSEKAFLHAKLNYSGSEPLLPGRVSLFRDNAFVGKSGMGLLRPEEDMKLSFGIDDAVDVEYKTLKEEKGTNGIIGKRNYVTRNFKTTVHNYHKQDIDIRILDRLPTSQHEDIKVEISKKTTEPSETDLDDLKGVLAWDFELNPNQEQVIDFGYTISYPKDRMLHVANR